MKEVSKKTKGIEDILSREIKYSIFNQSTIRLTKFINKLYPESQKSLCTYLTSDNLPFSHSPFRHRYYLRVKFDILKALNILGIKKRNPILSKSHMEALWKIVLFSINNSHNILEQLKYNRKYINNMSDRISNENNPYHMSSLSRNISNAPDGPSVDLEYGKYGIPSFKPNKYKMRYRRK